ncbi:unnamed protein product, partial [Didymodactylos carnosus]
NDAGNVFPNGYSTLPKEPILATSRSLTSSCGCTRVLTFDDISNTGNDRYPAIPNGYGGLTWTNALIMNTTWERVTYGWNGYASGLSSGVFVGFNSNAQQMSMSVPVGQYFQLNSISLCAAWRNNLTVTIKGIRANIPVYQTVINLPVASKNILYTIKWAGIDKVTLDSVGGIEYPNLNGVGTQFVFDDIDITI